MKLRYSPIVLTAFVLLGPTAVPEATASPGILDRPIRETVEITDTPYIAQVRLSDGGLICNGAILNFLYILTTAWCVNEYVPGNLEVVVGSSTSFDGTSYEISEIIPHEDYGGENHENDIAMLKLASYLRYSTSVRPIRIPEVWESEDVDEGTTVSVSVWSSLVRLERFIQTVNRFEECYQSYASLGVTISSDQICTTSNVDDEQVSSTLPYYDRGSPLVRDSTLIGLRSWATEGHPDIYTNVASFAEWIEENNLE